MRTIINRCMKNKNKKETNKHGVYGLKKLRVL